MISKTRLNFWVDMTLLTLFIAALLVGLGLWLIFPAGRSGSAVSLLGLTRHSVKEFHAWIGVTILAGAVIHVALHWRWVTCLAGRFFSGTSAQARLNFGLDSLLLVAFSLTSLSGLVIWLVLGGGGYRGGRNPAYHAALFGFTRPDWVDFHGWASLAILLMVSIHVALHWRWIVCALRNSARMSRGKVLSISA
ncbi:MAG: DUF4405 domain-containing protein [Anaerolineales bacterium]|nr:DUF4405 domain-containing protein [Anaerolineales bacterium]